MRAEILNSDLIIPTAIVSVSIIYVQPQIRHFFKVFRWRKICFYFGTSFEDTVQNHN
jgi:hypothetical protein